MEQTAKSKKRPVRAGRGGADTHSITDVLAQLNRVRKTGPDTWQASCPAPGHGKGRGDQRPSLSITADGDKVLLHCHAGCSQEAVLAALNLPRPGRNGDRDTVATYTYRTAEGQPVFQVRRSAAKDFIAWVPKGDRWETGKGVLKGVPRPLYRLPELTASTGRVYFCEGEKDVDNLAKRGLVATTNPGGALSGRGAKAWRTEWNPALKGREVVALQDNDNTGDTHVQVVARGLQGVARSVKVLALPDLPPGGDVSDWLGAGGTAEQLEALADAAPEWAQTHTNTTADEPLLVTWKPTTITAAELVTLTLPEPRWAVGGVLPEGLAVLAGNPKAGKSWLALGLACAVASGGQYIGQATERGGVLFIGLEDTRRRLQGRLNALGAAPEALELVTEWPRADEGGLSALDAWLTEHPETRLVVVDTWGKFRAPRQPGQDVYESDYTRAGELKTLADRHSVTILIIHHTRKSEAVDFIAAVSGSFGLTGSADSVLVLSRTRGQADAVLRLSGRDLDEQELALGFSEGVWSYLGSAQDYAISEARRQALDALRDSGGMAPKPLAELLGKHRDNVKQLLRRMELDGLVTSTGGTYYVTKTAVTTVTGSPESPQSPSHRAAVTGGDRGPETESPGKSQIGTHTQPSGDAVTPVTRGTSPGTEGTADAPELWPTCKGCKRPVPQVDAKGRCQDCQAVNGG